VSIGDQGSTESRPTRFMERANYPLRRPDALISFCAPLVCWVGSSVVEQRPFKPLVVGSSPTRPTSSHKRSLASMFRFKGTFILIALRLSGKTKSIDVRDVVKDHRLW